MSEVSADQFSQSKAHIRVSCEILEDGIRFEERRAFSRYATRVAFEAIPDDVATEMRISRPWAVIASLLFLWLARLVQPLATNGEAVDTSLLAVSAVAFAVSVYALWANSGHYVNLVCEGRQLEFLDLPGSRSPRSFLMHLQEKKGEYLTTCYGPRPPRENKASDDPKSLDLSADEPGRYRH